ncbi:hypothetical protein AHAS_Ahas09G0086700 [Arachis hypogaea]
MYILHDHLFCHLINTLLFNPDMHYEFLLHWLHVDASFHPFHDGPEDIPVEQISVSSFEPSSKEPHTTSISGSTSVGQISSTSSRALPKIVEISDDEDEDLEEYSDAIVISSDDNS